MKARKLFQRTCGLSGVAVVTLALGGLLVTRLLPPWVPLSWRPRRVAETRQPLA